MRTWPIAGLIVVAACSSSTPAADSLTTTADLRTGTVSLVTPSTTATTPSVASPDDPADAPVTPDGFDSVAATITAADGTVCEVCLWLAATSDDRSRGLMFVTDLGGADGMAFVYDEPHRGAFWMKDTVMPLSIAFFDADGLYLDAFDMEPCTADPCRRYPTPNDFTVAIETGQGNLPDLEIAPGSRLALTTLPCP